MTTDLEKEREAFEAWAKPRHYWLERMAAAPDQYSNTETQNVFSCWQARAALAASAAPKSQARIDRLKAALEGECDGLAISDEHAQAILEYIDEQPAAPKIPDDHYKPPFDNCSFRLCDLPGQCRSEGKCHHPATVAAPQGQPSDEETVSFTTAPKNIQAILKQPAAVHVNMLRGIIAPITFDQLAHVLGDEAKREWLAKQGAPQGGEDAKPVATLHGDGYWTWKMPRHEHDPAFFKMDVYATPQPAGRDAEPVAYRWRRHGRDDWHYADWIPISDEETAEMERRDWDVLRLYATPQPAGRDAREVPSAVEYAATRELAVTKEWGKGWDACREYMRSALTAQGDSHD